MKFIHESLTEGTGTGALSNCLTTALKEHGRVLWLVCGGSSIATAVRVMDALPEALTSKLHIMLTDERYGTIGHPDSNFLQLQEAGFNQKSATFIPILQPDMSLVATATAYAKLYAIESTAAGFIIAQFGIGADGHIAGILPGSPAANSDTLSIGYETEQYKRITLTFSALRRIDKAYAFAYGITKQPALLQLKDKIVPLQEQPSQILRQIPEAYVYNDCIAQGRTTT